MAQSPDLLTPPRIAEKLLTWIIHPDDREAILGDMAEECIAKGTFWYWQQAFRSLPMIIAKRLESVSIKRTASIGVLTLIALVAIFIWDVFVARNTARYIAGQDYAPALLVIRMIYFIVQLIGVGIIGGLVSKVSFRKEQSFTSNALTTLSPIIIALLGMTVFTIINLEEGGPVTYHLLRAGLSVPALLLGAFLLRKVMKH
jgi:hypothetical protein